MTDTPHPERPGFDLAQWLAQRLDRMEQTFSGRIDEVVAEAKQTRHDQRLRVEQLIVQSAVNVQDVAALKVEQEHQADDIEGLKRYRWMSMGAVSVLVILFPVTVGVIASVVGK